MRRTLRVGTRGSDLAIVQTRWVCNELRKYVSDLAIEEVIIATHGDHYALQPVTDEQWPMGGFTSAIERALLEGTIDLAVHSLKDLPVQVTSGTIVAATPMRESPHDVLVTAEPVSLDALPNGMRIGTSSPRRAAQIKRCGNVETVALRGNVPTRIARVGCDLDGVILAAAGLRRLNLTPPNKIDLPLKEFLPAPGQGALAVQVREDDDEVVRFASAIDDVQTRLAVTAERALLAEIGGGCSAPVGAFATVDNKVIRLQGQVFPADGGKEARDEERGDHPEQVARRLADRLRAQLEAAT